MNLQHGLLELVSATIQYLQEIDCINLQNLKADKQRQSLEENCSNRQQKDNNKNIECKKATSIKKEILATQTTHSPKNVTTKEKKPIIIGDWQLNLPSIAHEKTSKFSSFFKAEQLAIPIYLLCSEEYNLLFLENMSRAITQFIAPSALFYGKLDTLLLNKNIKLIIAPLSIIKHKFSEAELHQFLEIQGSYILPLADTYNIELKHHLWNLLKNFHLTHLSS